LDGALKITGTSQGAFGHLNSIKTRTGYSIVTWSKHGLHSPRDASSGLASGKRQHEELVCSILLDPSIINIYSALSTNEVLKTVELQLFQTAASSLNLQAGSGAVTGGEAKPAVTYLLENAVISAVEFHQPYSRAQELEEKHKDQHVIVKFTYQKITITWTLGGKTYVDDWTSVT
jgi:type VI secretion system secreted protein Hcp